MSKSIKVVKSAKSKSQKPDTEKSTTDLIREMAAQMREDGGKVRQGEIAQVLGCSRQLVSRTLGGTGTGGAERWITDEQIAELKQLIKAQPTWSGKELVKLIWVNFKIKYSSGGILNNLRRLGIKIKATKPYDVGLLSLASRFGCSVDDLLEHQKKKELRCSRCKMWKKHTEFWKNANSQSGRQHYCIDCTKERAKETEPDLT